MLVSALSYVTAENGAGALVSLAVLASGLVALSAVSNKKPIDYGLGGDRL
jgi:hypothetical protein